MITMENSILYTVYYFDNFIYNDDFKLSKK